MKRPLRLLFLTKLRQNEKIEDKKQEILSYNKDNLDLENFYKNLNSLKKIPTNIKIKKSIVSFNKDELNGIYTKNSQMEVKNTEINTKQFKKLDSFLNEYDKEMCFERTTEKISDLKIFKKFSNKEKNSKKFASLIIIDKKYNSYKNSHFGEIQEDNK